MLQKKLFTIFILIFGFTFGQNVVEKNSLFTKSLKKDSAIADFTKLYNLTNTIHPAQFMYCPKKDFDKTYADLKNSISSDLSIIDFYKLTATLMAKIKDGHTAVDRSAITNLLSERLVFPFSIYKIRNSYYLNKTSPENSKFTSFKLLKINNVKIENIFIEISKYIHLEGNNETGINTRFRNFPFYYFIYDQSEKFEIEYLDDNNQKKRIDLTGIKFKDFNNAIKDSIQPLSTEIKENKIGIIKFHSFENGYDETDRKNAEKQLDDFFNNINNLKIKNLIIDFRDNGGGSAEIANYLFSYLTNKPYYYFDYVGAKFNSVEPWKHFAQNPENIEEINIPETKLKNGLHCYTETESDDFWWFEKQKNKPNFFNGKLSVLINGGCFSTTGHILALLRNYKVGIFYGEYSQGSNYSNSGGQAFILPYSKTLVWIPIYQYKMRTPNFKTDPKGIKPDFEIEIQPKDLKTNFDRQLDFVMKKIR